MWDTIHARKRAHEAPAGRRHPLGTATLARGDHPIDGADRVAAADFPQEQLASIPIGPWSADVPDPTGRVIVCRRPRRSRLFVSIAEAVVGDEPFVGVLTSGENGGPLLADHALRLCAGQPSCIGPRLHGADRNSAKRDYQETTSH